MNRGLQDKMEFQESLGNQDPKEKKEIKVRKERKV